MATVGNKYSLVDVVKSIAPDGGVLAIAELLAQHNELLQDIPWIEGNLPTGHRTSVRTGLPDVIWRKLNQGVPSSKSTRATLDEACGILEARCDIDKDLAMLNGNTAQFRLSEAKAFIEAMNIAMQRQLIYGDRETPEAFVGLANRFNAAPTNSSGPATKEHVIDAGGTGTDNTSIYLIGWGENTVHGIYPKGSLAGLHHEDLGEGDAFDPQGNRYRALMDHYQWKAGIAVPDWRYVVRIANIDVSELTKDASAGADLIDLMTQAEEMLESFQGVRASWAVNRTVRSVLRRQIVNKVTNSTLTMDTVDGKRVLAFGEAPVRRVDALVNNEARVI